MTTPDDLRVMAGWMSNLADLTRHGEAKPSKGSIAAYATMLGEDFAVDAFNTKSLHYVVAGLEWFPAYDVIRKRLREFVDANQKTKAIAAEAQGVWTQTDESWMRYWQNQKLAGFPDAGADNGWDLDGRRRHTQSLVRRYAPRVAQAAFDLPHPAFQHEAA